MVIVGGGISGLAAAYRITQRQTVLGRPTELLLLDAGTHAGGYTQSTTHEGFLLENGADGFLTDKPRISQLCRELGITREMIQTEKTNRRSFIVFKGKLVPIPEGFYLLGPSKLLPILTSPLLTPAGKWRLLKEPFTPLQPMADETLASFVRRRMGIEVLERLAQPIAAGIYGADPEKLGMRATFPQFLEMERTSGGVLKGLSQKKVSTASGARYELFASFRPGMQLLSAQLRERLGDIVRTGYTVQSIAPVGNPPIWHLQLSDGQTLEAHAVLLALPAPAIASLTQGFDAELAGLLRGISYSDSMTVYFGFKESDITHPLNGFGLVVPEAERRNISACTFVHRKYAGRAPAGMALLRVFIGGATAARLWGLQDADIQTKALADLTQLLGIKGKPTLTRLQRLKASMPQYGMGHLDRVEKIDARVANWTNFIVTGNWGRGVGIPDSVENAERAAERLLALAMRY